MGRRFWEENQRRKGKGKGKERKKKGKKEGRKIKKEGKERREGKGGGSRPWPVVAGGGRRWPEVAVDGRPKTPSPNQRGCKCSSFEKFGVFETWLQRVTEWLIGKSTPKGERWRDCWWPRWCR